MDSLTDILALYMAAGPRVDNLVLGVLLSAIPVWLAFVQAEKYRQGVPLLEGPIWRRPSKPQQTIAGEDTAPSKTAGSGGHSQVELGSAQHRTPFPELSQGQSPLGHLDTVLSAQSDFAFRAPKWLSMGPFNTTGLVVYRPLEVHSSPTVSLTLGCAILVGFAFAALSLCLFGRLVGKKLKDARKPKKTNLSLSGITLVEITPSAPAIPPPTTTISTQTIETLLQHYHEEKRELRKVIELMEINAEKTQTRAAKLQQQNRGLRWAGKQKTKSLAAIEARAAELRLPSADHATNEPAQANSDPEDVLQEDHKVGDDPNDCAQREESEECGKNKKEEEQKKAIVENIDCDSDASGEILDLSLFFKTSERKKRRRIRRSQAVQAENALSPEDPVGGDPNNESPSSPLSHDLPRKDIQGTAVDEGTSTPSATALTFAAMPDCASVKSAQGSRDKSGEEKETVNAAEKDATASKIENHDDNGKKLGNEDGNGDMKDAEKGKSSENGKDGRRAKADGSASNKKQEDGNVDGNENGWEAGEEDGKEFRKGNGNGWEAGEEDGKEGGKEESRGEPDKDLRSESGEILEHDGLDRVPAVGEGKRKKHNMRQNAKRRALREAAAEEASTEVGEPTNAFREGTEECGGKHGKAKEVGGASEPFREDKKARGEKERKGLEVGKDEEENGENDANNAVELLARDLLDTDPSEPPEAREKNRRSRGRKHDAKDHALHDINHEPDDLAKDSQHGMMTKKAETNTKGQERKKILANDMNPQTGRAQINGKTFPDAPTREGQDHPTSLNPPPHNASQDGGDYQRLKKLLDESTFGRAQTNNGAITNALPNERESPTSIPQQGQIQGRAPVETPLRNNFFGQVPWGASSLPYTRRSYAYPAPAPSETQNRNVFPGGFPREAPALSYNRRSYTYPDQGTTNHAQRPIFVGPGVEPRNLVGPSTSTPWTSICSWQPARSFSRQGPLNEPINRSWNDSAVAGLVPRGRLPYPDPPLEHWIDGFAQNSSLTPFRAPFFFGSHSSSRSAAATSDGFGVPFQGPIPHVDDTNARETDESGIIPELTLADRSDERYQYFPDRGVRSRSSPPRSESRSRSSVRNRRSESLPPHHSGIGCIE